MSEQFSIHKIFNDLGLADINSGTSDNINWYTSDDTIQSISPVDGKLIASCNWF